MLCLLVDDEALACEYLQTLLGRHPDVTLAGRAGSGDEALELVRRVPCEVVFLDIQMPPPGGLEVCRQIMALPVPPAVVFLTAHPEFSLEAFEVGALDYLLKPVRRERLAATLDRIRARLEPRGPTLQRGSARALEGSGGASPLQQVALKEGPSGARTVVSMESIRWFTSEGSRSLARVRGGMHEVGLPLSTLERLAGPEFLRTHRAYLVNLRWVVGVLHYTRHAYTLVADDGSEVPLSRNFMGSFRARVPEL